MNRGKLLILFIFGVSLAAAVFAWWHQYAQGRRSLAYWGSAGAMAIRTAPEVTLLRLSEPAENPASPVREIAGTEYEIAEQVDLTKAGGLVHARQALITDVGFDWDDPPADSAGRWQYLLRFGQGEQTIEMALNLESREVQRIGQPRAVRLSERLASGLKTFFAELLEKRQVEPAVEASRAEAAN